MKPPLLQFTNKGIYCAAADVYLDPWRPVDKALITHGHSDHSRWGHKQYITHNDNVPIIKHRLGDIHVSGVRFRESVNINNVHFSFHPAGHIPGSSQIRVVYKGEVWVFTGDYKTENDGISVPYEPVKCHTFITECTFGLPAFKWTPQKEVFKDINQWWSENKAEGKTSILFGYSLGKAQRIMKLVEGLDEILVHNAIYHTNNALEASGIVLPKTQRLDGNFKKEDIQNKIIIHALKYCMSSPKFSPESHQYQNFTRNIIEIISLLFGNRKRKLFENYYMLQ